jgi:hypothetical protein
LSFTHFLFYAPLRAWLLFCFPRSVYHLYQQIFCRCRFLLFQANFGFCLLGLIALVKPLERLPEQTLGRVFYSPAPLFLALALLKRGGCFARTVESWLGCLVVYLCHFPLLGYLMVLQTHPGRCFLRIRGEGVS